MIWLGWRQQRAETLIAAGILATLAALLIPTGLNMASAYDHSALASCLAQGDTDACRPAIDAFTSRFAQISDLLGWITLIPGLIGILLAAPFVGQLEHGTYRLDWTQSITRGRWIAGKLGLAIVTALAAALALTLLVTWWRTPFVHLQGRMNNSVFDSEGSVVFGYTLLALGLATAVGAIWRRSVSALVVAFAGYFAARLFVDTWLRQRLVEPLSQTWSTARPGPNLAHAWVLSEHPSDRLGHAIAPSLACPQGAGVTVCHVQGAAEPGQGIQFVHAVYEPTSAFWAIQTRETALFVGLAVVLLAFSAWWTHQRAA